MQGVSKMTKPTWVFIAGPYRSGSTTQYQITRDIVEETKNGIGIGYHTEGKLKEFDAPGQRYVVCKVFEFLPDGYHDIHDGERFKPSYGKAIHGEGRAMAVVSVRDPRDIIVSMRKRSGDQFNFQRTATVDFPRWLGNAAKWADVGYWSRFEDFTLDLPGEVRRIAAYLGIRVGGRHAEDIARRYTVGEQRKRGEEYNRPPEVEKRHLPSVPGIVFGTSGHWRTWLNEAEWKMVYEANKEFFKRFGYAAE
jgi:hypothetical protein